MEFFKINFFLLSIVLINLYFLPVKGESFSESFIKSQVYSDFAVILNDSFNALNQSDKNVSKDCSKDLTDLFINKKNIDAIRMLIQYSSHFKNELHFSSQCISSNLKEYNSSYLILSIFPRLTNYSIGLSDDYGFCIVYNQSVCTESDLFSIIINIRNRLEIKSHNINETYVKQLNVKKEKQQSAKELKDPFLIIFLILMSFYFILFLYTNFFRSFFNRKKNISEDFLGKSIYSRNSIKIKRNARTKFDYISNAMQISTNFEALFSTKKNKLYKERGNGYISGVRCLMILLSILGLTYHTMNLSHSLHIQEDFQPMERFSYVLIVFAIRFAPGILFSCSGFLLTYKFICFLDDKIYSEDLARNAQKQMDNVLIEDSTDEEKAEKLITQGVFQNIMENNSSEGTFATNKVKNLFLYQFFFFQFYKYILGIVMILFYLFVFFNLIDCLLDTSIYLDIFKMNYINEISTFDIFSHLFLFQNLNLFEIGSINVNNNMKKNNCTFPFFSMFYNEVLFFIFTTPIIFICYKKRIKLNIIFLGMFILFFSIRLILFYFVLPFYFGKNTNYSTRIFISTEHNNLFLSSFFSHYSYFIIGALFGLTNYVVQKGISANDVVDGLQNYIQTSAFITETIRMFSPVTFGIIIGILVFLLLNLSCFPQIFFKILKLIYNYSEGEDTYNKIYQMFEESSFVNFMFLIDGDLVVLFIHLICLILYLNGVNILERCLSKKLVYIINRGYTSYIINHKMFIYYIIFQFQNKMKLQLLSIVFYSLVGLTLFFIIEVAFTILLEFPLKRITQNLIHGVQKKRERRIRRKKTL